MTALIENGEGRPRLMTKERDRGKLQRVPKLCGADVEFGNFILGIEQREGTGAEAARAVLREIDGAPQVGANTLSSAKAGFGSAHTNPPHSHFAMRGGDDYLARESGYRGSSASDGGSGSGYDPQDWGRKFLPDTGGCAYIDLNHLECCIPEVVSAFDHVAASHATLRKVRTALRNANARLPEEQRLQVLANNSDGLSHSYGSHLNFLITRRAWDNIFERKLQYQIFLATFQASSIVITGQGKVGAENGAPEVRYQLSQRADFFETLAGLQTTYNRPLVNSRDEPLCGGAACRDATSDLARLHCIFFDNTLCHVSSLLKVGMMQIVLAMIEAEEEVNPRLLLDDPVAAVQHWSHDPTLQARADMMSGSAVTAVELQLLFLGAAKRFVAGGGCDGVVPRAGEILGLWEDTLLKLEAGELTALVGRLDWVLKRQMLERALQRRRDRTWDSPEIKVLDQLYSSLDEDGLYWAHERSGLVERVVSEERIAHFEHNPPEDTRAWTRAMLLRLAGSEMIESIDWDAIVLRTGWSGYQPLYRRLDLANPLGFTRAQTDHIFRDSQSIGAVLDALGATTPGSYNTRLQQARAVSYQ